MPSHCRERPPRSPGEAVRRGLPLDPAAGRITLGGTELSEGDTITIDVGNGHVYLGTIELAPASDSAQGTTRDETKPRR